MKVAIVHDWLTNYGGAERVLQAICSLYPDAPIYTVVYDEKKMSKYFGDKKIYTSYIQKMPFGVKKYTSYLPLLPGAVERWDLSEYDLIISSSTCCAKGVLTRADATHICYCATPMRYAWDFYFKYRDTSGTIKKFLIPFLMKNIRIWDAISANRVDRFIANSQNVANRIKKHYRRDAKVIYPFADTGFYTPGNTDGDYYLVVSRLVEYKRIDIAVEAFTKLNKPLVVVGEGRELDSLKKLAGKNITFAGWCTNEQIRDYYRGCKAFIFPGEEDFGITPVESQACGRPVIAYKKGGALETVVDGKTGIFFPEQSVKSLTEAVLRFESTSFDKDIIRENASRFSQDKFISDMKSFVEETLSDA